MTSQSRYRLLGRKWRLSVLAVGALLALAVSCGGDDARPEGTPEASPSPEALAETATPGEEEDLTPAGDDERGGGAEDDQAPTPEWTPGRIPPADGTSRGTGDGSPRGEEAGEGELAPGRFAPVAPALTGEADGIRVKLQGIADPFNDPLNDPEPGTRFVGFDVTIEGLAGGSLRRPRDQDFQLIDAAGTGYSGRFVDTVAVGALEALEVSLAFTVKTDATPKLLRYDPDPANPGLIEFGVPQ